MKMSRIKEEIAKLLVKFASMKTDNGILEFDGTELIVGMDVYVTNEDGEKNPAADGEYATEDNKVIVVKEGKVAEINDVVKDEEPVEEVKEETTDETVVAEDVARADGEPITEEDIERVEDVVEDKVENDELENIKKEINELYKLIDGIMKQLGDNRKELDEKFSKMEEMSMAKPIAEEFEQTVTKASTNDKRLEKFNAMFGR